MEIQYVEKITFIVAGCYYTSPIVKINETSLRHDPRYTYYYLYIAQNIVTGIIPLLSLVVLNYLIYKHLTDRKTEIRNLGMQIFVINA